MCDRCGDTGYRATELTDGCFTTHPCPSCRTAAYRRWLKTHGLKMQPDTSTSVAVLTIYIEALKVMGGAGFTLSPASAFDMAVRDSVLSDAKLEEARRVFISTVRAHGFTGDEFKGVII